MTGTFLDRILDAKRSRVATLESAANQDELRQRAAAVRASMEDFSLTRALSRKERPNIIAEIKRASPSRGELCADADVASIAKVYQAGGAAAISILTEEDYFQGSLNDLKTVREACDIPILRKDFVVSEFQIYESAACGADAILLIVAALSPSELQSMLAIATFELRMDAIVEVHSEDELTVADDAGAKLIGVNNRNLRTFETSLDVSRQLIAGKRPETLYISESGIDRSQQISELQSLGYDAFLIGETLMRAGDDRTAALTSLMGGK